MKQVFFFFFCWLSLTRINAQPDKFSAPPHFGDLHTLYTYQKSNWDGSHASTIFLYVADTGRLQSFKWSKGDERATLVTADVDWQTLSVKKFQNHQVTVDGKRILRGELNVAAPRKVVLQLGPFKDSMTLENDHWHSYDFDFASLGFSWRALKNKKDSFSFLIADVAMVDGKPAFVNKGQVQVDYAGEETIKGTKLWKYKIDGPGLEKKGGDIWINPNSYMIEQYKIALPDEEGFENGMLVLQKTEKLSPEEWKKFMAAKMSEK